MLWAILFILGFGALMGGAAGIGLANVHFASPERKARRDALAKQYEAMWAEYERREMEARAADPLGYLINALRGGGSGGVG